MFASQMLFILAQVLLLTSWIGGGAGAFLLLYFIRMPVEEKMMLAQFGEKYRAYRARTGRVEPRLAR